MGDTIRPDDMDHAESQHLSNIIAELMIPNSDIAPECLPITPICAREHFAPDLRRQIICLNDILNFEIFFDLPATSKKLSAAIDDLSELVRAYFRLDMQVSAGRRIDPEQALPILLADAQQRGLHLLNSAFIWRMKESPREDFANALRDANSAISQAINRCRILGICS